MIQNLFLNKNPTIRAREDMMSETFRAPTLRGRAHIFIMKLTTHPHGSIQVTNSFTVDIFAYKFIQNNFKSN